MLGIVPLRELVGASGMVADHVHDALVQPETKRVVQALRELQVSRERLALVADEYGGWIAGIVTVEDLVEEIVGEIWDETDRDVIAVERLPDGSMVLPGSFPAHDLVDLGVEVPTGDTTTIAGVALERLGRIPDAAGDAVDLGGWIAEVLAVEGRAITSVRLVRR